MASVPVSGLPATALSFRPPCQADGLYTQHMPRASLQGEVLRWHLERGVEKMAADQYIQLLESQVCASISVSHSLTRLKTSSHFCMLQACQSVGGQLLESQVHRKLHVS